MTKKTQSKLLKTLLGKEVKTLQIDGVKNVKIKVNDLLQTIKNIRRSYGR